MDVGTTMAAAPVAKMAKSFDIEFDLLNSDPTLGPASQRSSTRNSRTAAVARSTT